MASNQKGDRRERELVNQLDEAGFAVMRAPTSGSATPRELLDVLAGNGKDFYAIEVKSSGGDPIYIDGGEITDLNYFATGFGAKPKIGGRSLTVQRQRTQARSILHARRVEPAVLCGCGFSFGNERFDE